MCVKSLAYFNAWILTAMKLWIALQAYILHFFFTFIDFYKKIRVVSEHFSKTLGEIFQKHGWTPNPGWVFQKPGGIFHNPGWSFPASPPSYIIYPMAYIPCVLPSTLATVNNYETDCILLLLCRETYTTPVRTITFKIQH